MVVYLHNVFTNVINKLLITRKGKKYLLQYRDFSMNYFIFYARWEAFFNAKHTLIFPFFSYKNITI